MAPYFFYIFATCTLIGAMLVVLFPNPLHGAVALIFSFVFLAGIYALMGAHFLAAIQVLVYAGAIMVLFLLVIMLLNLDKREPRRIGPVKLLSVAAGIFLVHHLINAVTIYRGPAPAGTGGTIEALGRFIFRDYLLPFEVASILLLVAMVGTVILARRDSPARGHRAESETERGKP